MNKTIKIGLIALAILAIGGVLWWTLSTPPEFEELQFDDSYFVTEVKQRCEAEIDSAASFIKAQVTFNGLLQDVQDAAFLDNIDSTEATNSKKLLARHYAPVLTAHADSIFASHAWNESHIDALKTEAKIVMATKMVESNSDMSAKLNTVIKNVSDYHAAKAATQCGRCTTVQAVKSAISKAKSYKRAPLNNCTSLMSELDKVEQKAKQALAKNIISACNSAASGHGSIDASKSRISEYVHAFGGERQFADAKSKLHAAESRAAAKKHERQRAENKRQQDSRDRNIENRVNTQNNNDDDDEFHF